MSRPRRTGPRVPQVNLFARPPRGPWPALPGRTLELILLVLAVVAWGGIGVAIALLVGWHPTVG